MAGNALRTLLWLFALGQVVLVYHRALGLFHKDDATTEDWINLSLGSIFLVGIAVLVYAFGGAGVAHVTALLP